jgi:hypothetical protein
MSDLTTEEKREFFVNDVIKTWHEDIPFYKKAWGTVTKAMEFVGAYEGWSGADKKKEVLEIIRLVLDKTDSPGPDFLVDSFIEQAAEFGIDYLYDAFKGKFAFDGKPAA